MSSVTMTYPVKPQNIDEAILQPSSAFKREVSKVLGAIIFFIVVYLVMATTAILLAAVCAWAGFALIVAKPAFITLMIGVGLIGLGVMVVLFLFKFLFKRNVTDRSNLIEIKEDEQPELFAFIRTLTKETQTPFPKKIYLSHDVNARVFYDSSFWSMFLPIRKNLQIGLGLVNAVNISEFKAILAHEFGHFSQRSMKLGSYVYNMNNVIYNLLFDNEGYERTLERWADASSYFVFFATITARIVAGIKWTLQKVYAVMNKSYMGLSQQMEFHADTVAAYVSGSEPVITSLRRLEIADFAYSNFFQYYNLWHKESLKPENIYSQHTEIMKQYAQHHGIPLEHGLPVVDASTFSRFNKTRIVVKDQWASHPSTDDREAHLRSLNIATQTINTSAWNVFKNAEQLQRQVTEKIYEGVTFDTTPQTLDLSAFSQRIYDQLSRYQLNNRYKGYLDARELSTVDLQMLEERIDCKAVVLEDILDEDTLALPYIIEGLKEDINALQAISQQAIAVRSFEFNGKKYYKHDAENLITQLKKELEETEARLVQMDERFIAFFLKKAHQHGHQEQLRQKYNELFFISAESGEDWKKHNDLMQDILPIYQGALEFPAIRQIIEKVKLHEVLIKQRLEVLMKDSSIEAYITEPDRERVQEYLAKDHVYFREPNYIHKALELLGDAMNIYQKIFSDKSFMARKELLEMQLKFL